MLPSAPRAPVGLPVAATRGEAAGSVVRQAGSECQRPRSAHGYSWQVAFIPWWDEGNDDGDLTPVV